MKKDVTINISQNYEEVDVFLQFLWGVWLTPIQAIVYSNDRFIGIFNK